MGHGLRPARPALPARAGCEAGVACLRPGLGAAHAVSAPDPRALPGAPFVTYRGAELYVEDCAAADLAARHGTPLYVYSRAAMHAALAPYQRALAGRDHLICYAMKANSSLAVLQTFAALGCGFDIVSGGELARLSLIHI